MRKNVPLGPTVTRMTLGDVRDLLAGLRSPELSLLPSADRIPVDVATFLEPDLRTLYLSVEVKPRG